MAIYVTVPNPSVPQEETPKVTPGGIYESICAFAANQTIDPLYPDAKEKQ